MSKIEKAKALWAIATDEGRAFLERQAAAAELLDLQKAAKVGWPKLGLPAGAKATLEARLGPEPTTTHQLGGGVTIETNIPGFKLLKGGELKAAAIEYGLIPPEADPLDEHVATTSATAEALKADPRAAVERAVMPEQGPAAADAAVRGLISAEVRRLLLAGDAPYAEIERAVRARFPEARTTTRSIASVASDMRRAGQAVSQRRKEAEK